MNKDLFELSYSLRKDFEKKVLTIIFSVISILVILNLIVTFLVFPLRMNSVSMDPDISKDSVVLFTPISKSVSRGDVVLVKARSIEPKSFFYKVADCVVSFFTARQFSLKSLNDLMGDEDQVRRVIGVPGDTIYMRDYVMYVQPADEKFPLTEFELISKSYNVSINAAPALWDTSIGVAGSFESFTLENNQYYVLGDCRNSSVDSRLWGPVDSKSIKAKALLCYFPFNKFKRF